MSEQHNLAVVQQAYAAFGRGDIPTLLATLDENIDWDGVYGAGPEVPNSGRRHGLGEVARFFAEVGKSYAFTTFAPREFLARGDTVVALGHYACNVIATGNTFESEWAMVFSFRNGKVVAFREFTDSAGLTRAFTRAAVAV